MAQLYGFEWCPDTGLPCDRCVYCQGEACGRCGHGPCEGKYADRHDVVDRHEGAMEPEARGL